MAWWKRLFHLSGATLSLALSLAVALLLSSALALGYWLQADTSLAQALRLATALLPSGQVLEAKNVSGSLRSGGHIGQLRWQQDGLVLQVRDLDVAWDWRAFLSRELQVSSLHAAALQVEDHTKPSETPFTELPLPVRVDLAFVVDRLDYAGSTTLGLDDVRGHYRYDGQSHSLREGALRMASGSYQLQGEVQAQQPMALRLTAAGTVQAPLTVQQQALQLQAQATAQGTLSGRDAALDVALDVQPQAARGVPVLGAMRATLQLHLRPGQAQPVEHARGQWTELDLASLWPQAPRTRLSGMVRVTPDGAGWKGDLALRNSLSGPLDRQRLPLQDATAALLYRNGQWQLTALQAAVAGGSAQAEGSYAGTPARWQLRAQVHGVHSAQVDTRWTGPPLDGQLSAEETPEGIRFATHWAMAAGAASSAPLQQASAKGLWHAPQLQFDEWRLEGPGTQAHGHGDVDTQTLAFSGQLQARVPGASLDVDGRASAEAGQGRASARIADAQALLHWLQGLPLVGGRVPDADVHGTLELTVGWSGGWRQLGSELQLQARARAQPLDIGAQHWRDLQFELNGSLRALVLHAQGHAGVGTQQLAFQARSYAGQMDAGHWHARLDSLALELSDAQQASPWRLQLEQALDLDWQQAPQARSLSVAAGTLALSGPAPGTAQVAWQPVQWSQGGTPGSVAHWSSKGAMQGVPLAWLELLGQTRLANLGLRGDLVFGGQWDASSGDGRGLRVSAGVQRSSGDLQLLSPEPGGAPLQAGLRDARVNLQVHDNVLQSTLVWASDAGGNVQAEFATRLQGGSSGSQWAPDAPLQGRLRANLPRVGAWSLLAPVGWRISGTMDADATLAGTRAHPLWKGGLQAHELAIRSVVDGIDFSQGVLRLQLDGQHMDITELQLQGAGGASGGSMHATGTVDWLPGAVSAPVAAHLRMALDAQAQGFRVSARPDQRLVVSGKLNVTLEDTRLTVRGALVADQALLVLPEDTAPRLGSDVIVKRGKPSTLPAHANAAQPAPRLAQTLVPDLSVSLDPGANFQLQGHGINARLAGLLTLKTEGRDLTPRLTGELHTVNGSYRAYGQHLNIEEGTLRFSGAYNNPTLNILALRPNLSQRVGVQVGGTAQLPVVRLYADPDMPDIDKLSWLVLGHPSSDAGAETALLQQAALALLAGNNKGRAPTDALFTALGLDEVSLGRTPTTNLDGSSGSETTVKLGKRLSRDFYVAYERSLAGTLGAFYIFYDLSRRLTLRAESGAQSAIDLIFTSRYD